MPATVATRRFTVEEYYRMAEAGILAPGERVELIEGEIVQMAAMGSRHAASVSRLTRFLVPEVGDRALVRVQLPIRLSALSEPEPEVALVRPRSDEYASGHPGPSDVLLVIEVADTTGGFDRDVKGPLYGAAGVPEYWIVDLTEDEVEVFRDPAGGRYGSVSRHGPGDVVRPLALSGLEVPVGKVLP